MSFQRFTSNKNKQLRILNAVFTEDINKKGNSKYLDNLVSVCDSLQIQKQYFNDEKIENKLKLLSIYQCALVSSIQNESKAIQQQFAISQNIQKLINKINTMKKQINRLKKQIRMVKYNETGQNDKIKNIIYAYENELLRTQMKIQSIRKYQSKHKHSKSQIQPSPKKLIFIQESPIHSSMHNNNGYFLPEVQNQEENIISQGQREEGDKNKQEVAIQEQNNSVVQAEQNNTLDFRSNSQSQEDEKKIRFITEQDGPMTPTFTLRPQNNF